MSGLGENTFALQTEHALLAARGTPNPGRAQTVAEARKVAVDFEAVFISQMLQPMFQNLSADKPFGGGSAEDVWRGMQADEYGKAIAKAGGVGIADAVFREIIKMQEIQ